MKGDTLTFHDAKNGASTSVTRRFSRTNAAFFMAYGVFWMLFLPFNLFLKIERFLKKHL